MGSVIELSIIVPVYNTADFLKECLDSIVDLSIGRYEVIVVNDGSTDLSEEIILEYRNKYHYISYYFQQNNGQGSARNFALKIAKGRYIYFMDSDDKILQPQFIEIFNNAMHEDLDGIFFDGDVFLDKSIIDSNLSAPKFNYKRKKRYGTYPSGAELYYSMSKNKDFFVSPCLYIVKRSVYAENNLLFPEQMKNEDEVFSLKLMFYLNKCMHEDTIAFMRRVRPNSTMTSMQIESKFRNLSKVVTILSDFYDAFFFENKNAKGQFYQRLSELYIKCLIIFSETELTESDSDYLNLVNTGRKHKYFTLKGKLATLNIETYKALQQFYQRIKNKDF